jgi:flagellar protein FlaG
MNINLHGATNPVATNSTTANPATANPATINPATTNPATTNLATTNLATTNTTTNAIATNAIKSGATTTHHGDASHDKLGLPLAVDKNTPEVDNTVGVNKALDPKGAATEDAPKTDSETLATIVEQLSEVVTLMNKGLSFSVHEDSGAAVVKVMDMDTGDIIRQIPSEEALELAQKLQDVKGLLLKTQA